MKKKKIYILNSMINDLIFNHTTRVKLKFNKKQRPHIKNWLTNEIKFFDLKDLIFYNYICKMCIWAEIQWSCRMTNTKIYKYSVDTVDYRGVTAPLRKDQKIGCQKYRFFFNLNIWLINVLLAILRLFRSKIDSFKDIFHVWNQWETLKSLNIKFICIWYCTFLLPKKKFDALKWYLFSNFAFWKVFLIITRGKKKYWHLTT